VRKRRIGSGMQKGGVVVGVGRVGMGLKFLVGVVSRVDGFPKDNDSALLCIT